MIRLRHPAVLAVGALAVSGLLLTGCTSVPASVAAVESSASSAASESIAPPAPSTTTSVDPVTGETTVVPLDDTNIDVLGVVPQFIFPEGTVAPTGPKYEGEIFGVGDSVMLGGSWCMTDKSIHIDAEVGRMFSVGKERIIQRLNAGRVPDRVLVGLGMNGEFSQEDFDSVMTLLGDRTVIWVNYHAPFTGEYAFTHAFNYTLQQYVQKWPNARILDYNSVANAHMDWFGTDGVHLMPAGCTGYAAMMQYALRQP